MREPVWLWSARLELRCRLWGHDFWPFDDDDADLDFADQPISCRDCGTPSESPTRSLWLVELWRSILYRSRVLLNRRLPSWIEPDDWRMGGDWVGRRTING